MVFCSKCGSKLEEGSLFCDYCGTKVKQALTPKQTITKPPSQPYYSPPRSSRKPIMTFIIAIIVMLAIFLGLFGFPSLFQQFSYEYIGDQPIVAIPLDNNITTLSLAIDNSVGDVLILTNSSATSIFHGEVHVWGKWGKKGATLEDANKITHQTLGDTVNVEFTSSWTENVNNPYSYNLELVVAQGINVQLVIEITTGNLDVIMSNVNVSVVDFQVTTGYQYVGLHEITLLDDDIKIFGTTGNLAISISNLNYLSTQTQWEIDTTTGNIGLKLSQRILDLNETTQRTFNINCTTGNIYVSSTLLTNYGVNATSSSLFGNIYLPNNNEKQYLSSNYATKQWFYIFKMETSTGSITLTHGTS